MEARLKTVSFGDLLHLDIMEQGISAQTASVAHLGPLPTCEECKSNYLSIGWGMKCQVCNDQDEEK